MPFQVLYERGARGVVVRFFFVDDRCQVVKGVLEACPLPDGGLPESRQIGRDHVIALRQHRNEGSKHVRGGAKAMEQQDRRGVLRSCFAVEDAGPWMSAVR